MAQRTDVSAVAQRTDVSAVANYFRVTWRSVRRIIQRVGCQEQRDERRELDGLRVIGMDEISYRKRHKYLTVVIDHLSGRVVRAGKERKAKTLLRFFRKLGPQRAAELEAVSMDMWEPYITVVGKKAPQARVIFDRFHIVKHLNEAVDKTRRELVRELKGTARRNLKNTKFPLLKANLYTTAARKTNGCSASRCELIVASTAPCFCATTSWTSTPTKPRHGPRSFSEDGCGAL